MAEETAPIRRGEEVPEEALLSWLKQTLPDIHGPLNLEQFPGGHSNLTYLLKSNSGGELVLRRAPLGPVAPKAHDMVRESRVLQALSPVFPAAPRVVAVCEDPSVIGAAFFLMERRRGWIIRERLPEAVAAMPDYPERVSKAFIDCLARLHALDVSQGPLSALGKPEGFLERQVSGWSDRWDRARTSEVPNVERAKSWLRNHLPSSGPATLVHNDYKLDNLMLGLSDPSCVAALLDWEMATLGDPLCDLGLALTYWVHAEVPGLRRPGLGLLTREPGWFSRERMIAEYAQRTGRDLSAIAYHEVLGVFKLAVILQQIYARYHRGQTQDPRFAHFDSVVGSLGNVASQLMERAG